MTIKSLHDLFLKHPEVCTDTRKIKADVLFFALKGENFNGNTFAHNALEKGAAYAIIDDIKYQDRTKNTILVPDVLKTLQELATYHRNTLNIPIIALTGSNGKTTTKELIRAVLSQSFKVKATQGNLNNHIGVPLTLLSFTKDTQIGIVEMGANHFNEISFLCKIARPNFGYITNFGKAHLEGFGDLQGVIKAKTELYRYLHKNNSLIFVNSDQPMQLEKSLGMNTIAFGSKHSEIKIQFIKANPEVSLSFDGIEITSHLIGEYNASNIAAAIAIAHYFKLSSEEIKQGVASYIPSDNRSQIIQKNTNTIILDAYNANPTSMIAALEHFKQIDASEKLLFLGDMFELGENTTTEHQNIVDYLDQESIGKAFLIGEHFYNTKTKSKSVLFFKTFKDLQIALKKTTIKETQILIKGSRGMQLERILELL